MVITLESCLSGSLSTPFDIRDIFRYTKGNRAWQGGGTLYDTVRSMPLWTLQSWRCDGVREQDFPCQFTGPLV